MGGRQSVFGGGEGREGQKRREESKETRVRSREKNVGNIWRKERR
jgi:hypothetical protein